MVFVVPKKNKISHDMFLVVYSAKLFWIQLFYSNPLASKLERIPSTSCT